MPLTRSLTTSRQLLAAIFLLLFAATSLLALEVPELTGRVNDYATILSPGNHRSA